MDGGLAGTRNVEELYLWQGGTLSTCLQSEMAREYWSDPRKASQHYETSEVQSGYR